MHTNFILYLLSRSQKVQNSAAKLVFKACKCDHVQPLLQALRWLQVQARLDYKLSTICHNFSDSSPAYFSGLLTVYNPSRQLCSSADTWILRNPHVRTKTFGQGCFSHCAQKQWNSLPSDNDIHRNQSSKTNAFKTALKIHLYKQKHKWFQTVFLLASPSYPPSPLITFLLCTCVCVCVCVRKEYNIMTI